MTVSKAKDTKTGKLRKSCAPLLVCTVSSQILNYVFPGNRKRRKKQLKNDAKKQNTPKKKGEKKHIPRKLRILFRIVWLLCLLLYAFVLFRCFGSLSWHVFAFCGICMVVFSVGFVCVCGFAFVVLVFSRNLYCFSSYVFTNELIC